MSSNSKYYDYKKRINVKRYNKLYNIIHEIKNLESCDMEKEDHMEESVMESVDQVHLKSKNVKTEE